ncbi:hypothetical protein Goklo_004037, partial [Gossypium klotzschianum]|nr:hypothetical protein [Gossypium klotzschianum]
MPICEAFAQIEQQLNICDVEPLKLDILISFRIMVFIWVWTLRLRVFHLLFLFRFPSQHTDFCHDGEELSLEFPDGTIPVTCVYQYMMVLQVKRDKYFESNKFLCPCCQLGEELFFTVGGQHIPFGASPQDVWSELGRPCGIHHMQVAMLQGV